MEISELQKDLAAAFRWTAKLNMHEGIANHFSVCKPNSDDFYVNGSGMHFSTIRASDLVLVEQSKIEEIKKKPDLVVVYGDVNSCVAAALVAKKLHLKVAHIEAGLRSFDRSMPEEINRIVVDSISDLHFVTCKDALVNLRNEGVNMENCYFVGNTMIDSLVEFNEKFDNSSVLQSLGLTEKEYALITLHRPSNVDDKNELLQLMEGLVKVGELLKCVFVMHPRTKNNLCKFGLYERYEKLDSLKSFHYIQKYLRLSTLIIAIASIYSNNHYLYKIHSIS